jgi:hypothetical protein
MENRQIYGGDWIDEHFGNEKWDRPFDFINSELINYGEVDLLRRWIKEVIRECVKKEKEFTCEVFKRLKVVVINECCFNSISRLTKKSNEKYEYIILFPQDCLDYDEALFKHKFAHEIAHFLFELKGKKLKKDVEERKCNDKAKKWGFPFLL